MAFELKDGPQGPRPPVVSILDLKTPSRWGLPFRLSQALPAALWPFFHSV